MKNIDSSKGTVFPGKPELAPAIVATDKDLNITTWNKAAEATFGWQASEAQTSLLSRQIVGSIFNMLNRDEVMTCLADSGCWLGEVTGSRKDNSKLINQVSLEVVRDDWANGLMRFS
jgi:PAS domain-containing protein